MSGIEYGDSFIQFGDGEPISARNIEITWNQEPHRLPADFERLPLLQDFSVEIPLPPANAAAICRLVGVPELADRIEIAAHPDLAELNVQMDGYYDGTEG